MADPDPKSEPLLATNEVKQYSRKHYFGLACNTTATLTFGAISLLVKLANLPPPLMLQLRSLTQWLLAVCILAWRLRNADESPLLLFFAPDQNRMLLILRAVMYWGFMMLWWAALVHMPAGDAVAIVYTNPIFAAIFASLLLKETMNPAIPYCLMLSTLGVALIIQPSFLFGGASVSVHHGNSSRQTKAVC